MDPNAITDWQSFVETLDPHQMASLSLTTSGGGGSDSRTGDIEIEWNGIPSTLTVNVVNDNVTVENDQNREEYQHAYQFEAADVIQAQAEVENETLATLALNVETDNSVKQTEAEGLPMETADVQQGQDGFFKSGLSQVAGPRTPAAATPHQLSENSTLSTLSFNYESEESTMFSIDLERSGHSALSNSPASYVPNTNNAAGTVGSSGAKSGKRRGRPLGSKTFKPGSSNSSTSSSTSAGRGRGRKKKGNETASSFGQPVVSCESGANLPTPGKKSLYDMTEDEVLAYGQNLVKEREMLKTLQESAKTRFSSLQQEHGNLVDTAKAKGLGSIASNLGIDRLSPAAADVVKKYLS